MHRRWANCTPPPHDLEQEPQGPHELQLPWLDAWERGRGEREDKSRRRERERERDQRGEREGDERQLALIRHAGSQIGCRPSHVSRGNPSGERFVIKTNYASIVAWKRDREGGMRPSACDKNCV